MMMMMILSYIIYPVIVIVTTVDRKIQNCIRPILFFQNKPWFRYPFHTITTWPPSIMQYSNMQFTLRPRWGVWWPPTNICFVDHKIEFAKMYFWLCLLCRPQYSDWPFVVVGLMVLRYSESFSLSVLSWLCNNTLLCAVTTVDCMFWSGSSSIRTKNVVTKCMVQRQCKHIPGKHHAAVTQLGNTSYICTSRDMRWTNHDCIFQFVT